MKPMKVSIVEKWHGERLVLSPLASFYVHVTTDSKLILDTAVA